MEIILFLAGFILSWALTHGYYRRSSTKAPEWAKQLIERLPDSPPSKERLLEIVQESIDKGEILVDSLTGHVACPECNHSAETFEKQVFGDDRHTIVVTSCSNCGWSQSDEV